MTLGEPPEDSALKVEAFPTKYLKSGTGVVDAIVTVTAGRARPHVTSPSDRAEVVIVDSSGSMGRRSKIDEAKKAADAAIGCLEEGVRFAVIAGRNQPLMVYPSHLMLVPNSATSRHEAKMAIDGLGAEGGTAIGSWLDLARDLFVSSRAVSCHAILLTDGRNEHQRPEELVAAIESGHQVFQCDGVGIGTDWDWKELMGLTHGLRGSCTFIRDLEDLSSHFQRLISVAQDRVFPNVQIQLWTAREATVEVLRQVGPEVVDLTGTRPARDSQTHSYLLSDWAPGEARDYHLRLRVKAREAGASGRVGSVTLVADGDEVAPPAPIEVAWTDDDERYTDIEPRVIYYTEQVERVEATYEGDDAFDRGDERTATIKLGRAVRIAHEAGDEAELKRLGKVVRIIDPAAGTVELRRAVSKADRLALVTGTNRTKLISRAQVAEGRRAQAQEPLQEPEARGLGLERTETTRIKKVGRPQEAPQEDSQGQDDQERGS